MIKEDVQMDYEQFLKEYVISPIVDFTISFYYKEKYYQFDFVGVEKNKDGSVAYEFVSYDGKWDAKSTRIRYKSLKEAIDNAEIDGLKFKEVFEAEESGVIDIS